MSKRTILFTSGVVAVVGVTAAFALPTSSSPQQAVALASPERRDLRVVVEASGLVEPVRVVEVKSKASGEALRVLAETGDRVEKGALLAEIDPRDVQSALEQAQADLDSARVKAKVTEAQRARMQALRADAVVTQQELEAAMDAAASARAAVVRNETALRLARERRGDVAIHAPIAGTVLSRSVEPGQIIASATANVSGGTVLFQMADLSQMQVRAKVAETDIGKLSIGQQASVTVEAHPGRMLAGTVAKIEPQAVVEQNVTLFPVLVRVDNQEGFLMPGMSAEVQVSIARRDGALAVSNAALVAPEDAASTGRLLGATVASPRAKREKPARAARGDGSGGSPGLVFVATARGIEPREVLLGLSDWEYTEVVYGLSESDQVVLASVVQLQQQQQAANSRMRERMGGVMPGSGGGRSRR